MIYSTCAISPLENDSVIARYFERKGDKARLRPKKLSADELKFKNDLALELEPTEYGHIILPDRSAGAGPMFFSALEKF